MVSKLRWKVLMVLRLCFPVKRILMLSLTNVCLCWGTTREEASIVVDGGDSVGMQLLGVPVLFSGLCQTDSDFHLDSGGSIALSFNEVVELGWKLLQKAIEVSSSNWGQGLNSPSLEIFCEESVILVVFLRFPN